MIATSAMFVIRAVENNMIAMLVGLLLCQTPRVLKNDRYVGGLLFRLFLLLIVDAVQ